MIAYDKRCHTPVTQALTKNELLRNPKLILRHGLTAKTQYFYPNKSGNLRRTQTVLKPVKRE